MKTLYFYTKKPYNYFSIEFLKEIARFLFRKSRGPQLVNNNLIKGLNELNIQYKLNKHNSKFKKKDIIFINSSIDALKWVVNLKKNNKVGKIIAGPNLVTEPNEYNNIIKSEEIDKILVPSIWVKKLYSKIDNSIENKICIWPSGIEDDGFKKNNKNIVIVFIKNAPNSIIDGVLDNLNNSNIKYKIFKYGKYKREEFLNYLDYSKLLIYLQESESQGITLLESWMKNVPTIVWSKGLIIKNNIKIIDEKISAPYLNNQSGITFSNLNEFGKVLKRFENNKYNFNPREYYLKNFTNKKSVLSLLNLINFFNKN